MNEPVEFLDLEDVIGLAIALCGDPPPIADVGLLGSAVARPRTSAFGEDAYPDLWTKAAALLQSVVKNHALIDGNKRLGWLATAVRFNPTTYLLEGMRALLQEGWAWGSIAKGLAAIAGIGAVSFTLAFRALRGRVRRN